MGELPFFGLLGDVDWFWTLVGIILILCILGYQGAPLWVWTFAVLALLYFAGALPWLFIVFLIIALIFNIPVIRQVLISGPLMKVLKSIGFLPQISDTERVALEAGTTWIDGQFFTGKPDFKRIIKEPFPALGEKEQQFMDGPVEEACRMVNDWEVSKQKDLSRETWKFLKDKGFFGMVIPIKYGGLGFTAHGMNSVVQKLASRSIPLSVNVMVPNSLGPAELLLNYGTENQKDYYLPRLAKGEDIPCFALTEPDAGSDAASIDSDAIVFHGDDGELYLRLNWQKRYITLSTVSTLLGLAFVLRDPENLLGKGTNPGITCGLIPTDTDGVVLGRRHNPLEVLFINGPTEGHDVVVSVNQIIGGPKQAGNGWKMLMETLSGGRGIFLPALNTGGIKYAARITGAYAVVRQQFGLPIGRFEGVEELMAPIGALAYCLDGLSTFTCAALDKGKKPAVISAIAKYTSSDLNRQASNNAMDILGGAGICIGPKNLLGRSYMSVPIGITVEGSNVLTRSLITFGQGIIRCHPYVLKEMQAIEAGDIGKFDRSFWGHISMIIRNKFRSGLLSLSRGYLVGTPVSGPLANYYRKLVWVSATFSFIADISLAILGGSLKIKEKLSGRFADNLSWMYLLTCALRKWEAEGRKKEDIPFVQWICEYGLAEMQKNIQGIYQNYPGFLPGIFFRTIVAAWSRLNPFSRPPSDGLDNKVAQAMQTPGDQRDRLTSKLFIPNDPDEALAQLETAFELAVQSQSVFKKIRDAMKTARLPEKRPKHALQEALETGIITQKEHDLLKRAEEARSIAISVDAFNLDELPVNLDVPQKVRV